MSDDLIEELSDGIATLTMYWPGTCSAMTRPMMSKMDEVLYMMRCFMVQDHKHAAQSFVDKVALEFLSRQNYVG